MNPQPFSLSSIRSNVAGAEAISELADALKISETRPFELNFSDVAWFDANMAAALIAVLSEHLNAGREIKISNVRPPVRDILVRNGLFRSPTYEPVQSAKLSTIIPLRRFEVEIDGARAFAGYTSQLFKERRMPVLSKSLKEIFLMSLDEVFNNSATHSGTKYGVFACGQVYPAKRRLRFTVVDRGIGMQKHILQNRGLELRADQAIVWAMSANNTSKTGGIPGGLGLKVLRNFVRANCGRLHIISDRGSWMADISHVYTRLMRKPFPGTMVTLEINTADTHKHHLRELLALHEGTNATLQN